MNKPKSLEVLVFIRQLDRIYEMVCTSWTTHTPNIKGEIYLSNKEVCDLLKISERTLQNYRDLNRIGYIQLERKILYKMSDIARFLEDNYVDPQY